MGALGESFFGGSREKPSDAATALPNPELNPLLNPTLGRHLGRWAQVYFTSPPEKREEAVGELLRQLKGQPEPAAAENEADVVPAALPARTFTNEPTVRCAECGHRHKRPQRFCGMCGAPLTFEPDEEAPGPADVAPQSSYAPGLAFALPSLAPVSEPRRSAENDFSDVRWLRDKNLTREGLSWRPRPRYAPAALAILAIGILIYGQWKPGRPQTAKPAPSITSSTTQKGVPPAATQEKSAMPSPAQTPSISAGDQATTAASNIPPGPPPVNDAAVNKASAPEENRIAEAKAPANTAPQPAASVRSSESAGVPNTANGSLELAQAEEFLNGKKYPRDSAMAAKFLWKAVGKENPSAILLLSDMYLIGDGVPKSCDQARLLLTAAARKNVPQAAYKLRHLLRSGCP